MCLRWWKRLAPLIKSCLIFSVWNNNMLKIISVMLGHVSQNLAKYVSVGATGCCTIIRLLSHSLESLHVWVNAWCWESYSQLKIFCILHSKVDSLHISCCSLYFIEGRNVMRITARRSLIFYLTFCKDFARILHQFAKHKQSLIK